MALPLTEQEIARELATLPGWRRQGAAIVADVEAPDFPTAIRLVAQVAEVAEEMNHHPDIDIRWRRTHWLLTTHDAGGLTHLDIDLAHRVSTLAADLGARHSHPSGTSPD